MKTVTKVISALLIIVLLLSIVGVVLILTNGGNEGFKTFYYDKDGKRVFSSVSTDSFELDKPETYRVHYLFDSVTEGAEKYVVKVYPNEKEDFEFTVDGEPVSWRRVGELKTDAIQIERKEMCFTITVTADMGHLLAQLYPNGKVAFPDELDDSKPYFMLYLANYNESVQYRIGFSVTCGGPGHGFSLSSGPSYTDRESGMIYEQLGGLQYASPIPMTALAGQKVTFSCRIQGAQYVISKVSVTDGRGNELAAAVLEDLGSGAYFCSFIMPACDATVEFTLASARGSA